MKRLLFKHIQKNIELLKIALREIVLIEDVRLHPLL